MAKALSPSALSLDFETAGTAPPEDLRLPAGSYGINISAVQLGVRARHALTVTVKIFSP